jgi:protein-tyrosine phosphatase
VGERRLPFVGTKNLRDLGGYKTSDGRRIKWGLLYRSGRLDELTENDQEYFSKLNIGVVCDFRREDEQVRCPSRLPKNKSIDVVDLPIGAGSTKRFLDQIESRQVSDDNMMGIMEEIYLDFARNQAEPYGEMFRRLLEAENEGMLIHCTAGKDRTGFGTALILAALGVAPETIMADYLLTTRYFPIDHEMRIMAERYEIPLDYYMKIMRPVFEVHPRYLQVAFGEIEARFRTVGNYLEEALGVTPEVREELRSRLLEE